MQVIASDVHRRHHAFELSDGKLALSAEAPRRAEIIAVALRTQGHHFVEPDALEIALVGRVHTEEYIRFLSTAWNRWQAQSGSDHPAMAVAWPGRGVDAVRPDDLRGQLGYHSFAVDCSIVAGTWAAAAEAAAAAQTAVDRVVASSRAVYALCRPPGHHATTDQFGGYCYLNNSAIAAQRLLDHDFDRVAVLDIDYHHGNGTQAIFYRRSDVLTVSIHADPLVEFPWFAGHAQEQGIDDGKGWNLNLPLAPGTGLKAWSNALDTALFRIARSRAQALVIAFGVDTFVDDPLGTFSIETRDYTTIAGRIAALDLPTVIVQEGGYAVDAIGENVAAFLKGFA